MCQTAFIYSKKFQMLNFFSSLLFYGFVMLRNAGYWLLNSSIYIIKNRNSYLVISYLFMNQKEIQDGASFYFDQNGVISYVKDKVYKLFVILCMNFKMNHSLFLIKACYNIHIIVTTDISLVNTKYVRNLPKQPKSIVLLGFFFCKDILILEQNNVSNCLRQ